MNKVSIMGILNVTPDSFSDGGFFYKTRDAVKRAEKMIQEGADIIDVGGESTRPGSETISGKEEIRRVLPVIKLIRKKFPKIKISIDTYRSSVAEGALKNGVDMVNCLGGFLFDKQLADVVAKYKCSIIFYHIKGRPKTMQKGEIKYKDIVEDISKFFKEQISFGLKNGIKQNQCILDPGIGFGKTIQQNFEIIRRFGEFRKLNFPLCIGVSRKSHLGRFYKENLKLECDPNHRLEGALAETAIAVEKGASIMRTHDVLETKKFLSVLNQII